MLAGDPLKGVPFSKAGRVARVERLLAPVAPPDILCIGLNYLRHYEEGAKKRGVPLPEKPCIFMKSRESGPQISPNMRSLIYFRDTL